MEGCNRDNKIPNQIANGFNMSMAQFLDSLIAETANAAKANAESQPKGDAPA